MNARRLHPAAFLLAVLAVCQAPPPATARGRGPELTAAAADSMLSRPLPGRRPREIETWLHRAPLDELVWILRRPASDLGDLEVPILAAALSRTPAERKALGSRLVARLALSDAGRARGAAKSGFAARGVDFPWSSVFRVGLLLPAQGPWSDEALALRRGVEAGLASRIAGRPRTPEIEFYPLADERPATAIEAFEWSASRCGSLVGGVVDATAMVLATASRLRGIPLVLPGGTGEDIGSLGQPLWQVGPSGWDRGVTLARAVIGRGPVRVGMLMSGALESPGFANGFAAACSTAGALVVFRHTYAAGNASFGSEIRQILARKVDLLFWDGDPREASAILRQLMRERIAVRICGGLGLSPDHHHRESLLLLEGVQFVDADWSPQPPLRAALAQAVSAEGADVESAHVRGFIAGALIGEAIAAGALVPEEIDEYLARYAATAESPRSRRFTNPRLLGVELRVHTVRGGRAELAGD